MTFNHYFSLLGVDWSLSSRIAAARRAPAVTPVDVAGALEELAGIEDDSMRRRRMLGKRREGENELTRRVFCYFRLLLLHWPVKDAAKVGIARLEIFIT